MGMKVILVLGCFCWSMLNLAAQGSLSAMGEAPPKGVYDPVNWLEGEKRMELEKNFAEGVTQSGVKIYVVVLPQLPGSGAESFARRVGRKWGGKETWGVLLHVIGEEESPWCVAEKGENLRWAKPEEIERAIQEAMSRAFREPDQDVRVMVGARELADELGFLEVVSDRRDDVLGEKANPVEEGGKESDEGRQLFLRRVMMITLPLLLASLVLVMIVRSSRGGGESGYLFPETAPRRRFSGPWSGGGNVLVRFSEGKSRRK